MKDEATYQCDSCGEEIVVPIDLTAGSRAGSIVVVHQGCFAKPAKC
jgi:hypothetical protein